MPSPDRRRWLPAGVERRRARRHVLGLLPERTAAAEVGSRRRSNAAALLRHAKPAVLYLIDPVAHETDCKPHGGRVDGQVEKDSIRAATVERFAGDERVIIKRQKPAEAARSFTPGCLTWVYIDGGHRYEDMRENLDLYSRVVHAGGWLAGDDYRPNGCRDDDVRRAVDEFVRAGRAESLIVRGTQFLIRLP